MPATYLYPEPDKIVVYENVVWLILSHVLGVFVISGRSDFWAGDLWQW
jgi:hypothetical protein